MKVLMDTIVDDIYPVLTDNEFRRHAVRGIILNENNEVFLIHIKGKDQFGERDHYELPGGGIEENENDIDALRREISEEIGYEITDIKEVGYIEIEYHLLKRIDCQHYYLAYATKKHEKHLLDYEKQLFKDVKLVNINEIEKFYQDNKAITIGNKIHMRDLCAIREAIKLLS